MSGIIFFPTFIFLADILHWFYYQSCPRDWVFHCWRDRYHSASSIKVLYTSKATSVSLSAIFCRYTHKNPMQILLYIRLFVLKKRYTKTIFFWSWVVENSSPWTTLIVESMQIISKECEGWEENNWWHVLNLFTLLKFK